MRLVAKLEEQEPSVVSFLSCLAGPTKGKILSSLPMAHLKKSLCALAEGGHSMYRTPANEQGVTHDWGHHKLQVIYDVLWARSPRLGGEAGAHAASSFLQMHGQGVLMLWKYLCE